MGNCQNIPDSATKTSSFKGKGSSQVIVTSFTWQRDSHGLFDYECKSLTKKVLKVQHTGSIKRNGSDIGFTKENEKSLKQNENELFKLNTKDGNFWINGGNQIQTKQTDKNPNFNNDAGNMEQDPWLVIKSYKANTNKGYKLSEGDVVKLGRVRFRIREVKGCPDLVPNKNDTPEKQIVNTEADNNNSLEDSFKKSPKSPKGSQTSVNHQVCRICLSETCDADDPFFSPCNCSGTMKLIHVKCLQMWLKSKLHTKVSGLSTFVYWKTLECELCKTPYPQHFEVDNKRYDVVSIDRPDSAYIIMDLLSKDKNLTRGVHLVKMEGKNNIRLGRGHDSDIRITDISVSRCHAIIKLDKGNFYIEDNNSKFGTLFHMSKPLPITGDFNNISVQIGRTVVTLTAKKGRGFFPFCFNFSGNSEPKSIIEHRGEVANDIFADQNVNEAEEPEQNNNNNNAANNNGISFVPVSIRASANSGRSRERNNIPSIHSEPDSPSLDVAVQNDGQNEQEDQPVVEPVVVEVPRDVGRDMGGSENEGNIGGEADERSYDNSE